MLSTAGGFDNGLIAQPDPATVPAPTIRELLQAATNATHERLHAHPGLAAVQMGSIKRAAYIALLSRLYGFHTPFDMATKLTPDRTRWLAGDLKALGIGAASQVALPLCTGFPENTSPEYILGARYVIEGSALGGRTLARQLDGLLGAGVIAGRHFFTGHGTDTGTVWRNYLALLSAAPATAEARQAIITGATTTFAIFEQWLDGWNS